MGFHLLFPEGGDFMKVKAKVSFSGLISMHEGEEREIENKVIYEDLLNAGYVDEVKSKKKVKADEN
jgi:hypothetical protein